MTLSSTLPGNSSADSASTDCNKLQLVTFEVGDEEFAVNILAVQEINRMMQVTRVPQTPPEIEGVINLRGRIIPVINLRCRFNMSLRETDGDSRIVVVEVNDRTVGFIVDMVHEVLRIDPRIVEPAPSITTNIDSDYIEGVGKLSDRLIILIDLERLFCAQTMKKIDQTLAEATE